MLSDRRQIVLKMLINEYIAHALPIGSRTLIDRYHLDISSATVRNELSHLEDAGYLTSPHTSAGRVPTDFGYRTFVDDLLDNLPATPDTSMLDELQESANELDNLIDRTSQAIARFTNCLSLIVPSMLKNVAVKQINLVALSMRRLLVVIITEDGSVIDRTLELTEDITPERLTKIESALNELFSGLTADTLAALKQSDPAFDQLSDVFQDPLTRMIEAEVLTSVGNQTALHARKLGISHLLDQPEFTDASRLAPLIEKLEDDTILFQLLDEASDVDTPFIRIGHENSSDELANLSVVASTFGEEGKQGLIAVIGPTRMNYELVINAVRTARDLLRNN